MTNISRRSILKTAGMAAAAGLASGAALATSAVPSKWDEKVEVLVVGAGLAGLSAALGAKDAGAKQVVVIDKAPSPFLNSTSYSSGGANGFDTKAQRAAGIRNDTKEDFFKGVMAGGDQQSDPELVKLYVDNSQRAMNWFIDHGVKFAVTPNAAFSVNRLHMCDGGSGAQYVQVLFDAAKKAGVDLRMSTRAVELITTPDGSEVLGVAVEDKSGRKTIEIGKGIVLATGGFAGDLQMMDRFLLDFRGVLTSASPYSTGDGYLMAAKIGAASTHMNYGAIYACGVPTDAAKRRGVIFRGHILTLQGPILVGEDAKRFIADEQTQTNMSIAMAQKGFKHAYIIASKPQIDAYVKADKVPVSGWTHEQFVKELDENKVFVRKANSIEELAGKLGLDPKTLAATVDEYNRYAKDGKDPLFSRKAVKGAIDQGPYYGFICTPVAIATLGGLHVNAQMRVLDVYQKPIKKLYAAGEVLGAVHGNSYVGGDSLGSSMALGRVAGEDAAKAA